MSEHIQEIATRLRDIREISGYSENDVAIKAGISVDDYIKYESGVVDIPVSVLYSIAQFFKLDLTELLTGDKPRLHMYSHVKNGKGLGVERGNHYKYKSLAYSYSNRKVEPLLVYVEPSDDQSHNRPNAHEGHEFHYCLEGSYKMYIGNKILTMDEGDSLYFDSIYPHEMVAIGDKVAKIMVIVI